MGREWVEKYFLPVMNSFDISEIDKLRTIYENISQQISTHVLKNKKLLITGGGAHNNFLVELIQEHTNTKIVIPSPEIINYKEALIFAFLGVLKIRGEINCLSSVTGASKDSINGIIFN